MTKCYFLSYFLKGPAADWYWDCVPRHGIVNWPFIKQELIKRFTDRKTDLEIRYLISPQPYAEIQLLGKIMCGLLDSGANVTILGKNCEYFLKDPTVHYHHLPATIRTANGNCEQIIGHIKIPVTFAGQKHLLTMHLAPNLKQELYLGIDSVPLPFPFSFQIDSSARTIEETTNYLDEPQLHVLTQAQHTRLETVKQQFPFSVLFGMGRTHLVKHIIDVSNGKPIKQRFYAVSAAVETERTSSNALSLRRVQARGVPRLP